MLDKKETNRLLDLLVNCKFSEVWGGRDLEFFRDFLGTEAVSAGRFVLSIPVVLDGDSSANGWGWICYRVKIRNKKGVVVLKNPMFTLPTAVGALQECPERWKRFPIWRLQPGRVGELVATTSPPLERVKKGLKLLWSKEPPTDES